jgi:predicted regulator of Ras-like GTPase activity (Roadblock/LC7/MglB family)
MLRAVDAAQALADLTEISSQIVRVAVADREGAVLASTIEDEGQERQFADTVAKLLAEADTAASSRGLDGLVQFEAATREGSVFLVRSLTGANYIAAVTRPEPTVGLVFYDLKHCLRSIGQDEGPRPRRRREKQADGTS